MEILNQLSSYFSVATNQDHSTAWLRLIENPPITIRNQLTGLLFQDFIRNKGIKTSISPIQIDLWIISNFPGQQIIVSTRETKIFSRAEIRLLIPENRILISTEYLKYHVEAGNTFASIIPKPYPVSAQDVFGNPILYEKFMMEDILGEGIDVIRLENEYQLKAKNAGFVRFENEKFYILPYQIDVIVKAESTKKNMYPGDVLIKGDILTNCEIRAVGDIQINGVVEGASLYAGKDIILHRQVIGFGKTHLFAAGTIFLTGAQDATLIAGHAIRFQHNLIRCSVMAFSDVTGIHPNNRISGGKIIAFRGIEAAYLGSSTNIKTILVTGLHPLLVHDYEELKVHLQDIVLQIKAMKKNILFLCERVNWKFPDYAKNSLQRCCYIHHQIASGKDYPIENLQKIAHYYFILLRLYTEKDQKLSKLNYIRHFGIHQDTCVIAFHKTIFPGVSIKIKNFFLTISKELSQGHYVIQDNHIIFQPIQGA